MKVSFLCIGIGWSAGTVIFGDLARTSLKSERATIYSVVMSARQFGIVAGMFLITIIMALLMRVLLQHFTGDCSDPTKF